MKNRTWYITQLPPGRAVPNKPVGKRPATALHEVLPAYSEFNEELICAALDVETVSRMVDGCRLTEWRLWMRGFTIGEIAQGAGVNDDTVSYRISRVRRFIADTGGKSK